MKERWAELELIRRDSDYALRALCRLALDRERFMTAWGIAESEDIPLDFLQKVLQRLVKNGFLISHRGAEGGFSLAKKPEEITVLDVVRTMQGAPAVNKCFLGRDRCPRADVCRFKGFWASLEKKIAESLDEITLRDLVDELKKAIEEERLKRSEKE